MSSIEKSTLELTPTLGLQDFEQRLKRIGIDDDDAAAICAHARRECEWLKYPKAKRDATTPPTHRLYKRWYDSIRPDDSAPDYSVYGTKEYLTEAWACWAVYSRTRLLEMSKPKSLPPHGIVEHFKSARSIVDVGCGIGYTTAALAELFPDAYVVGTQLPDTYQWNIAETLIADGLDFDLAATSGEIGHADIVFASEYFEHFQDPIRHLIELCCDLSPRVLLVANTFNADSIGHFDRYKFGTRWLDGRAIAKKFSERLKAFGFRKLKTGLWNNRPALYVR